MYRKVISLVICVIVMLFAACKGKSEKRDIRLFLTQMGFDCPNSPDEYHLYPWEMFFNVIAENHTDNILSIRHSNDQYAPEEGIRHGYFQWIMDADTMVLYSRGGHLELHPDSLSILGLITAKDSVFLRKFNIEGRDDTLEIKRNLESLIQRSRMRFVPIPEDYGDIPNGYATINSTIEVDISSFSIDYLLGGRGSLFLDYDKGKIHYKGWVPGSTIN